MGTLPLPCLPSPASSLIKLFAANELNRLQGENEALKEEVKRLRGPR